MNMDLIIETIQKLSTLIDTYLLELNSSDLLKKSLKDLENYTKEIEKILREATKDTHIFVLKKYDDSHNIIIEYKEDSFIYGKCIFNIPTKKVTEIQAPHFQIDSATKEIDIDTEIEIYGNFLKALAIIKKLPEKYYTKILEIKPQMDLYIKMYQVIMLYVDLTEQVMNLKELAIRGSSYVGDLDKVLLGIKI